MVWTFFVACILALPLAAMLGRFDWALILTGPVPTECGAPALVLNELFVIRRWLRCGGP